MPEATLGVPTSTIILLRDGPSSLEVFLVERSVKCEFLPRLYAFPGGRVEHKDRGLFDRLEGVDASEPSRRVIRGRPAVAPSSEIDG
jgi:8-oxo-dGTP pyrophosphatase MutT (NUDIX family)